MTSEELWTIALITGIGLIVGLVAKLATPNKYPRSFIVSMLIGVAGALGSVWLGLQAGWYEPEHNASIPAAGAGAVIAHLLDFSNRLKRQRIRTRDDNQRHWN